MIETVALAQAVQATTVGLVARPPAVADPDAVARFLDLPAERMLFAGIALGWRDDSAPINALRTERDPFDAWGEMRGFGSD